MPHIRSSAIALKVRGLPLLLAGAALVSVVGLHAQPPAKPGQFAAAIASLAAQVRAEIARLPRTSKTEEYEAAILFLADQSGQPVNVVCAAFDEVKADGSTPDNARIAMNSVCRSMKNRRGTGALGSGAGGGYLSPGFSAPVVSIGGGSSTYSRPQ